MSNYNNNYPSTLNLQEYKPKKEHPDAQAPFNPKGFQELDENLLRRQAIVTDQFTEERMIKQNINQVQSWENLDQVQQPQHQPPAHGRLEVENKNKYQQNFKKDAEASQISPQAKQNYIVDSKEHRDQNLAASYCSQSDLTKSNLLSESSSIHSNQRSWRELNARKTNKNVNNLTSKSINNKQKQLESLDLIKDKNKYSKPAIKYLFYEQKQQEAKIDVIKSKELIKTQNNQLQANKKQKNKQMIVFLKQKTYYSYKKGKKEVNQTQQQRVRQKIGFILDCFQDKHQVASVSYFSESQLSELPQKPKQQQEIEIKQDLKQQEVIQQRVIFAEQPKQPNQLDHRQPQAQLIKKIQMRSQAGKAVVPQKIMTSQQQPIQTSQQLTPKHTIDLDKSFKSKSKNTKKSNIMMKSLQKSKGSQKPSSNTPITRKRRDSLQQMQQIIAQIQQKSQQFQKAVSLSVLSKKNDYNNDPLGSVGIKPPQKRSTKSAINVSSQHQNKLFQVQEKPKAQQQANRYDQKPQASRKSEKQKSSSNQSVNIQQAEFKITPTHSSLIKTLQKRQQSISSASKQSSLPFQTQQSPQKIHKRQQFQKIESIHKAASSKRDSLLNKNDFQSSFNESLGLKDRPKIKQLKEPAKIKSSYLKTFQRSQIDEGQLISEFIPKNKVQFKIDSRRRLKSQLSQDTSENKKLLAFLKRREEAVIKKSKQQHQINPRIFMFPEESSGLSKQSSMRSNQQSVTEVMRLSPIPLKISTKNSSKDKIQTIKKKDSNNNQGSLFPILNTNSIRSKQTSKTFYAQNKGSMKKISNQYKLNSERRLQKSDLQGDFQKDGFDKEINELSNKFAIKPPSNRVEYLNLGKPSKQKSPMKNTGAKQKYEKLKKLLGQS